MNIFIGCSSSDEISVEYKTVTKYLASELSKENDLVFGSCNRGLMGICYREFLNNNRKITGICYEMYKDDLKDLILDEVEIVKSLEESNKMLVDKSDIIIFLPGGYGTLTEFMHTIESKRTNLHNKDIIILNINGFYNGIIDTFDIINEKISKDYDYKFIFKIFSTVDELIDYMKTKKSSN